MMNAPAWQSQRFIPAARPYSSDHFPLDSASPTGAGNGKWMQQVEYYRMLRSMQKGSSGDFVVPSETSATPTWLSSQRNVDLDELSPGIQDLHSFDTELLPEISVRGAGQGGNAWGGALMILSSNFLDSRNIGKLVRCRRVDFSRGFRLIRISTTLLRRSKLLCAQETTQQEGNSQEGGRYYHD